MIMDKNVLTQHILTGGPIVLALNSPYSREHATEIHMIIQTE